MTCSFGSSSLEFKKKIKLHKRWLLLIVVLLTVKVQNCIILKLQRARPGSCGATLRALCAHAGIMWVKLVFDTGLQLPWWQFDIQKLLQLCLWSSLKPSKMCMLDDLQWTPPACHASTCQPSLCQTCVSVHVLWIFSQLKSTNVKFQLSHLLGRDELRPWVQHAAIQDSCSIKKLFRSWIDMLSTKSPDLFKWQLHLVSKNLLCCWIKIAVFDFLEHALWKFIFEQNWHILFDKTEIHQNMNQPHVWCHSTSFLIDMRLESVSELQDSVHCCLVLA